MMPTHDPTVLDAARYAVNTIQHRSNCIGTCFLSEILLAKSKVSLKWFGYSIWYTVFLHSLYFRFSFATQVIFFFFKKLLMTYFAWVKMQVIKNDIKFYLVMKTKWSKTEKIYKVLLIKNVHGKFYRFEFLWMWYVKINTWDGFSSWRGFI